MTAAIADLRTVPLFQGMTDRALAAIAELAGRLDLEDGTVLTAEGEGGDAFYLVLEGVVRVSRAGERVGDLGPGDVIGEIALVDGRPRTATTVAVGPVRLLVVRRAEFLDLMERYPAVRLGVMMSLTDRIRSDERALAD